MGEKIRLNWLALWSNLIGRLRSSQPPVPNEYNVQIISSESEACFKVVEGIDVVDVEKKPPAPDVTTLLRRRLLPLFRSTEARGIPRFSISWRYVPTVRTYPAGATLIRRAAVLHRLPK